MSVILKEDHFKIIQKIKRRALITHLVGIGLTLLLLVIPLYFYLTFVGKRLRRCRFLFP
jgi:hypothetical protein